jgi:hypothetical protein
MFVGRPFVAAEPVSWSTRDGSGRAQVGCRARAGLPIAEIADQRSLGGHLTELLGKSARDAHRVRVPTKEPRLVRRSAHGVRNSTTQDQIGPDRHRSATVRSP